MKCCCRDDGVYTVDAACHLAARNAVTQDSGFDVVDEYLACAAKA